MTPATGPHATAVACNAEQCELGEGIRWDSRRDELLRVDILAGKVFRDCLDDDGELIPVRSYNIGETVGAVAPVAGRDGWLLASGRGFVHLSMDGTLRTVAADVAPVGTRLNDAACDQQGRFWAGTMAHDQHSGGGRLYRLDWNGRVEQVLDGLTIPNGLGWSPDGETMYVTDSAERSIHEYAFDPGSGLISGRRVLVVVAEEIGAPDGLTVDASGDLWVAIYGAGRVHRYSADGALRGVLTTPALQTTCCAFAGAGMHRLYVTTATEGWTDRERRGDPRAGAVYRFDTDAVGTPAAPFRPDSRWWQTVMC